MDPCQKLIFFKFFFYYFRLKIIICFSYFGVWKVDSYVKLNSKQLMYVKFFLKLNSFWKEKWKKNREKNICYAI